MIALIEAHPDPAEIAAQLRRLTEFGIAKLLPSEGSDAIVQAFQDVVALACARADEKSREPGR
ncbi:hypothetical protein [Pseudothauera rhizosphaerae]|uniref:Uncharacterized protein n=1 Tax=Pseudothauera rhizosphaerae TaxID=2565932 RepID=A0A4S4ACP0_9RHOO|nr:hypothetical protein [Pseudothauera rhizosphaerae]THF55940.1 hypothetical protein E6O51_20350 [Pseudothauera rhizosphaerae]